MKVVSTEDILYVFSGVGNHSITMGPLLELHFSATNAMKYYVRQAMIESSPKMGGRVAGWKRAAREARSVRRGRIWYTPSLDLGIDVQANNYISISQYVCVRDL